MGIFGWEGDHSARSSKPPRSKPPKPPKKGGGLCVQVAPFAAWPALVSLAGAIAASFIG